MFGVLKLLLLMTIISLKSVLSLPSFRQLYALKTEYLLGFDEICKSFKSHLHNLVLLS